MWEKNLYRRAGRSARGSSCKELLHMRVSHPSIIRVPVISVVVLAVFGVLFWHNNVLTYDGPPPVPAVRESIGVPARIIIPRITVAAPIEKVALTADGSMDVPKLPRNTGWFALGPRPGETGSAVIAGHVDWLNGATAVFASLHKVQPGDNITVIDDAGKALSFVVRESRTYDATEDATDVFSSNDGKAHLNLITCYGAWDKRAKQYTKRLVVFAERVQEPSL